MYPISSLICCKSTPLDQALDKASTAPLYIGIALSVAGVALTILLGAHFIFAVGSILLGIVCIIGLYHTKKAGEIGSLQEKINSLETIKTDLEKTNQELKENVSKLEKNITTFTEENGKLQTNISNMETENQKLQESNKELGTQIDGIKHEKEKLGEENIKLGTGIATLKGMIENSKKVLRDFQDEREKLENTGAVIGESTKKLAEEADSALKELNEGIKTSNEFLAELTAQLQGDLKESVQELNENLRTVISQNLKPLFKQVSEQNKELGAITQEISEKTEALETVRKKLEEVEDKLREREKGIAKETKRLSQVVTKAKDLVSIQLQSSTSIAPSPGFQNRIVKEIPVET